MNEPLAKCLIVLRQAQHERKKNNDFKTTTVRPEPVEGYFWSFARGSNNMKKLKTINSKLPTDSL